MSVSEIVQRLELLEEHCKIEATKVARLWGMHEGVMAPHVVPKPPAIPTGEAAGVRSDAEPWKTYNPLPVSLDSVAHAAPAASVQTDEEDADIGYALRLFVDGRRVLSHELDRQQAGAFLIAADHLAKYLRTEYQAQFDESAPAASVAAGNSPAVPVSSDPVAYFVKWAEKDWGVQDQTFRTLERAQDYIKDEKSEDENPQIVPLFAAPQPAPGWLTQEERKWIEYMKANCVLPYAGVACMEAILARSSPPEVVLPEFVPVEDWHTRDRKWIAALAAAGGKVKEVE